jgi:hypothetical protein
MLYTFVPQTSFTQERGGVGGQCSTVVEHWAFRPPPTLETHRSVKNVPGQSVKDVMGLNTLNPKGAAPIAKITEFTLLKMTDGSANHEFGGQNPAAEGHLRMMQPLQKHLHAGLANLFFMHADGGKRRVHQDSFFTIVETD